MAAPRQGGQAQGGRARGRLLALALLAFAVVPLLALRLSPPSAPERPVALMAPAGVPHAPPAAIPAGAAPPQATTADAAPAPEIADPASAGADPAETQPGASAAPSGGADSRPTDQRLSAGAVLVAPPPARPAPAGPERWRGIPSCPRDRITGGQYNRCLYEATRTSEQAMEAALTHAFAVIEARSDLQGAQRNRWKTMLDEAQSRFLLFRNLDCQGVAPFEGPRGIGNFEQRALCLVDANTRRAAELRARYVAADPAADARAPQGPQDRSGTWTHAVPPVID